jgi:hypothetical protein
MTTLQVATRRKSDIEVIYRIFFFSCKLRRRYLTLTHAVKTKSSHLGNNQYFYVFTAVKKKKGKAVPLQAWSGPEGSRKLRFPDYMTTAQDGGKIVSLTHRPPLPPGNAPGTHFC